MLKVKSFDALVEQLEQQALDLLVIFFEEESQAAQLQSFGINIESTIKFLKAKSQLDFEAGKVSSLFFSNDIAFILVGSASPDIELEKAMEKMRIAGGITADKIKDTLITPARIGFFVTSDEIPVDLIAAYYEGLLLKSFSEKYLKSQRDEKGGHPLKNAQLTCYVATDHLPTFDDRLTQTQVIVKWTNHARWLSNLPPNLATPTFIANKAVELSKNFPTVEIKVLSEDECEKLGMGSFLGVAKGTDEPAKFVIMEYKPESPINEKPYVFVGKGITFDSGGISIKGREGMDAMKHDMQGAAVVQSLIFCAAELNLPLHVVGLTPLTENLPSGKAYKPADVVTALNGKTIEIISTDAEGRMILADALAYAEKYLDPELIVDIATLTGGIVVALGGHAIGLFSNKESLARELLEISMKTERAWQMPLWEEYDEYIKSDVADFKNSGGRPASSVTAARLLSQFVDTTPWAHLDIAGMAWNPPEPRQKYLGKGATGAGHRLLANFLIKRALQ